MAAANFNCSPNTKYIYAWGEQSDFEEYLKENRDAFEIETDEDLEKALNNEYIYSDWSEMVWEDAQNDLYNVLEAKTADNKDISFSWEADGRVYDGDVLAKVRKSFVFAGEKLTAELAIYVKAGYYAGFTFDWDISDFEGYDYMPDSSDCEDILSYNTFLNEGLQRALAPKLAKRFEAAQDALADFIDDVLQAIAPYHLTGVCLSNGAGWYTDHKGEKKAA